MSKFGEFFPVLMPLLFGGLFVGVLAFMAYRFVKYGGLRGSLFGSTVAKTVGQVDGKESRLVTAKMNVHVLESKDIGIDITSKTFGSWQMHPVTLERGQVEKLIQLLQQAVDESR